MKTAIEILHEAAALVRGGWVRGLYVDVSGPKPCFCALGAIHAAATGCAVPGLGEYEPSLSEAVWAVRQMVPNGNISHWNDKVAIDAEQVASLLEFSARSCTA